MNAYKNIILAILLQQASKKTLVIILSDVWKNLQGCVSFKVASVLMTLKNSVSSTRLRIVRHSSFNVLSDTPSLHLFYLPSSQLTNKTSFYTNTHPFRQTSSDGLCPNSYYFVWRLKKSSGFCILQGSVRVDDTEELSIIRSAEDCSTHFLLFSKYLSSALCWLFSTINTMNGRC